MKQIIILMLCICNSVLATTRYVDLNSSSPTPPYTSWTTAAHTIQDAVDVSADGDMVIVGDGHYFVTSEITVTTDIHIVSENGSEFVVVDGSGVSSCFYLQGDCLVDGLTITNSYSSAIGWGGAIYCSRLVSPVITNCIVIGNTSERHAGGMVHGTAYNCSFINNRGCVDTDSLLPGGAMLDGTAHNCLFKGNSGDRGGGMSGGKAYDCIFTENTALYSGGGTSDTSINNNCLFSSNSATFGSLGSGSGGGLARGTANNCTFIGNTASGPNSKGGGIFYGTANNCLFVGNHATSLGGGLCANVDTYGANNCTFVGNTSSSGGGIEGGYANNCIIWGNTAVSGSNSYNTILMHTCSPEAAVGDGNQNITDDPLFVDPLSVDYQLQQESPCRDVGNNDYSSGTEDLSGNSRIVYSIVDMGAYEYQALTLLITLEESEDLISWTNTGNQVIWNMPIEFSNAFYRAKIEIIE